MRDVSVRSHFSDSSRSLHIAQVLCSYTSFLRKSGSSRCFYPCCANLHCKLTWQSCAARLLGGGSNQESTGPRDSVVGAGTAGGCLASQRARTSGRPCSRRLKSRVGKLKRRPPTALPLKVSLLVMPCPTGGTTICRQSPLFFTAIFAADPLVQSHAEGSCAHNDTHMKIPSGVKSHYHALRWKHRGSCHHAML